MRPPAPACAENPYMARRFPAGPPPTFLAYLRSSATPDRAVPSASLR
jgi:hypothetical protein